MEKIIRYIRTRKLVMFMVVCFSLNLHTIAVLNAQLQWHEPEWKYHWVSVLMFGVAIVLQLACISILVIKFYCFIATKKENG
ncbi:MAG TPA: hypothetical protein VGO21_05390 [Candidatus Paceibacterota bacterium]|jgi:hypothetical protein|nr:hypothetical protein [Candidatus Paceibacterota bacterium]